MPSRKGNISTLASHYIVADLGIRNRFFKAIESLGISIENNEAEYHQGFFTQTFIVPEKQLAIKFFNQEFEPGIAKLPNNSRYMLQPLCHTSIVGNQLAIFPMLSIYKELSPDIISQLHLGLNKEGYIFDDDKPENIGYYNSGSTSINIDYVIDGDAVRSDTTKIQNSDTDRPYQWNVIPPIIKTDTEFNLDTARKEYWEFAPEVLEEMSKSPETVTSARDSFQLSKKTRREETQQASL